MTSTFTRFMLFFFFGSLALQFSACKEEKTPAAVKQVQISFKKEGELELKKAATDSLLASLDIEIDDDAYATQTGLMYRSSMEQNHGMLFIFPDDDFRSFYMKNTEIALDIIYISEDKKIVSIQKNTIPMNESSLPSEGKATYVLEVNAGLSDQWTLEKGDYVTFSKD
ncbi:MAG: DUF192 domain-containing protein [Psychroserpens sp.]|uniref:DUF192 domain-containing protein n=1 Tax=Psychroserpens sp. TaxID=2020870 RepID=UPI003CA9E2D3